jgi:hypothetical protein
MDSSSNNNQFPEMEQPNNTEDQIKTINEKTANITDTDTIYESDPKDGNALIFYITCVVALFSLGTFIVCITSKDTTGTIMSLIVFLFCSIYIFLALYLTFGYDSSKVKEKLQGSIVSQMTSVSYSVLDYINSVKPISSLQGGNNPSSNLFPMPNAFFKVYSFYWTFSILIFFIYLTSHYMTTKDTKAATFFLVMSLILIGYTYLTIMYDGSLEALKARKAIRLANPKAPIDLSKGTKGTAFAKLINFSFGRADPIDSVEIKNLYPFIYYTILFLVGLGVMGYYIMNKQKDLAALGFIIAMIGGGLMGVCLMASYYE